MSMPTSINKESGILRVTMAMALYIPIINIVLANRKSEFTLNAFSKGGRINMDNIVITSRITSWFPYEE